MEREYADDDMQRKFNNLRIMLAHEDINKSMQYAYLYFIHFSGMKGPESVIRDYVVDLAQPFQNTIKLITWIGFDHIYTKRRLSARQLHASVNKYRKEFNELGCRDLESFVYTHWPVGKIVKFINTFLIFMFDCKIQEIEDNTRNTSNADNDKLYGIQHNLLPTTDIRPYWRDNLVKVGTEKHIHIVQKPSSKNLIVNCPITYRRHIRYIIEKVTNTCEMDIVYNDATEGI